MRTAPLRLCCALALLSALVAGCGSSGAPVAPRRAHSNLISIIEAEGFLHTHPARALSTFHALGVDEVRVFLPWSSFAPDSSATTVPAFNASDPGAYPPTDWPVLDEIVRDAAVAKIGLDFTIGGPVPAWAEGPGAPRRSPYDVGWMPSAARFGQFVHALGLRYSGHYVPSGQSRPLPRVDFWSIWNEPNYGHYLSPEAIGQVEVAPRLYHWPHAPARHHPDRRDGAPRPGWCWVPGRFRRHGATALHSRHVLRQRQFPTAHGTTGHAARLPEHRRRGQSLRGRQPGSVPGHRFRRPSLSGRPGSERAHAESARLRGLRSTREPGEHA